MLRGLVEAILGTDLVWLQSHDEFDAVATLDPREGQLERFSRKGLGSTAPTLQCIKGWYFDHSVGTLILYRLGGKIVFRVLAPGVDKEFELDTTTEIEVRGPSARRELTIVRDGVPIFKVIYAVREVYRSPDDLTPFIEDEDFDFGLFVSNISKNPARKSVFLGRD